MESNANTYQVCSDICIIGRLPIDAGPLVPYSDEVVIFLDELSKELRNRAAALDMPDIATLSFWCRKGNILRLKGECNRDNCLGRGIIFHVTPSNVPVNFAFSYIFGLLAGCANIVRVPNRDYPQITVICDAVRKVLDTGKHPMIQERTVFVQYGHDKDITDYCSGIADARIIWGGNAAINEIRKSAMKPKSTEIVFADRYSLGIIDAKAVINADDRMIRTLADNYYNDTYLMDQNACSSPHLIMWVGDEVCVNEAKDRFWDAVMEAASKYNLEAIKAVDKYTDLCMLGMDGRYNITDIRRRGNRLYTLTLGSLPDNIDGLRGRFGMFYEYTIDSPEQLAGCVNEQVQTLLYYGLDAKELKTIVLDNRLSGIDRIVPFGKALDMNVYWDGYDIIGQLSRRIEIV